MAAVRKLDGNFLTQNTKHDRIHIGIIQERHFIRKTKTLRDALQPRQGLATFN
jgi:hypothetical protein